MSLLPEATRTPDGYRVERLMPGFAVYRGRTLLFRCAGWTEVVAFIRADREERRLFRTSTPLLERAS